MRGLWVAVCGVLTVGCSYHGGFVAGQSVVVNVGSRNIEYVRSVSGKHIESPGSCAPSEHMPVYRKAMQRLHQAAQLRKNELLMNFRYDLVRRGTGMAICKLHLEISADVYRLSSARGSALVGLKGVPDRSTPRARASSARQSKKPRVPVVLSALVPNAGPPGAWVQLRGQSLNHVKEVMLVDRSSKVRQLAFRVLSSRVLLVRIPSDTSGGKITYQATGTSRNTNLRYFVVSGGSVPPRGSVLKLSAHTAKSVRAALRPWMGLLSRCLKSRSRRKGARVRILIDGNTGKIASTEILSGHITGGGGRCLKLTLKRVVLPQSRIGTQSIVVRLKFR